MKLFRLLVITLQICFGYSLQPITTERPTELALCLATLINSTSANFHHQINLFADSKDFPPLAELFANQSQSLRTWNLIHYGQSRDFNHRQLVVWFVDREEEFLLGADAIERKNIDFRGYFVVVLQRGNSLDGRMILERFWAMRVTRVVLLSEAQADVVVMGYQPFRPGCCQCVEPVVVDRCRDGIYELGKFDYLFNNEVRSCYGCSVRVVTFTRKPMIIVENGSVGGTEGQLLQLVAHRMEFGIEVRSPVDGVAWGVIKPNGSADGAIRMLLQGAAELTIGGYVPYPELGKFASASSPYWQTQFVFVVPEELAAVSSLEQLVKPFQWLVWILVVVSLVVVYGVIFGLNHSPVGRFDRYPLLALFRVIIGDSLPRIPRGNFFRFLLFLWLYYGLIIRESYKCFMIGYLTEREPLTDISSLEALVHGGYQLGVTQNLKRLLFEGSFHYHDKLLFYSDDEYREGFERVIKSQKRIAMITLPEVIVDFNRQNPFRLNFRICDENVLSFHYSVYFQRSSPLVPRFSVWIGRIVQAGITEKWRRENLNKRYLTTSLNDQRMTVLTNGHLFSGYVFYAMGLLLATVVFVLEILTKRNRRLEAFFR
ncbi:uncharacterized protein LOC129718272 [Wyeomyia smithii]|uniref:uncharacterized protein LOC129718272 n=1 Tax=Wyeomyia smithii TaxID=174621 RepID=UPI002467E730|nr:uncharacterized protein LOC129718272 [Wyeomyia smithii]